MANRLMMKRAVLAPEVAGHAPEGVKRCHRPRVLVVDDEALMRWSVAETLLEQGCEVTTAADAASALRAFPEVVRANGIVFLDLCLPDSNDLHVLAAMHRQSPSTPVIVMTAHGTSELGDAARALGACAVINKPFDPNDLIALVNAAAVSGPCDWA